MAEINKINIKGVDYDIGGGGLKGVEITELENATVNGTITITEDRFNEIKDADILNIKWNGGFANNVFAYRTLISSVAELGIYAIMFTSPFFLGGDPTNTNNPFFKIHVVVGNTNVGDVNTYVIQYYFIELPQAEQ